MEKAFEYVIKNNGVDTESSYPYEAVNGKECKYWKVKSVPYLKMMWFSYPPASQCGL